MKRSYKAFLALVTCWELLAAVMYSLYLGLDSISLLAMSKVTSPTYANSLPVNFEQYPWSLIVAAFSVLLIVGGCSMLAAYAQNSVLDGIAHTILLFAFTLQNFFLFRALWSLVDINGNGNLRIASQGGFPHFNEINYINYSNDLERFTYNSGSLIDAVGCSLALFIAYSSFLRRTGLLEIFSLSLIGTLFYELNNQILWRIFVTDNGYIIRAFLFGGMTGFAFLQFARLPPKDVSKYTNSQAKLTLQIMGAGLLWCLLPVLSLANTLTSTTTSTDILARNTAMATFTSVWLGSAASLLGCISASSIIYQKISVTDLIMYSSSGAFAYLASSDLTFLPSLPLSFSFGVCFFQVFLHHLFRKRMEIKGKIDSGPLLITFVFPAACSTIFTGVIYASQMEMPYRGYRDLLISDRSSIAQGGIQVAGGLITAAIGSITGVLLRKLYMTSIRLFSPTHQRVSKVQVQGERVSEVQVERVSEVQVERVSRVQVERVSEVQVERVSRVQGGSALMGMSQPQP